MKKVKISEKPKLNMLCFSFYNLDYGIGASASFLDQLNSLPKDIKATVIEPKRVDLPRVKVELANNVHRIVVPFSLTASLSFVYPFLAFFYGLRTALKIKPDFIFSMHHAFHYLSLTGHVLSKILSIPHIVDLRDVWRPMGQKLTIYDTLQNIFEILISKLIKKDLLVFVCNEHLKILELRAKIHFNNVLVLPNCVSDQLIKGVKKKKALIKKVIKFIYIGRVGYAYGLNRILNVIDALSSFGYEPRLLVVGHNQIEVPKCCKFIGNRTRRETIQLVAESDVGIGHMQPTNTIPRKVVEYLALGKIIILAKNSISADILRDYGELILEVSESDDSNQVALKLLSMLKNVTYKPKTSNLYCSHRMKLIIDRLKTKNIT